MATGLVTDPVCGMEIDPQQAAAQTTYAGTTYYFDSLNCQQQFERAPDLYVQRQSSPSPQTAMEEGVTVVTSEENASFQGVDVITEHPSSMSRGTDVIEEPPAGTSSRGLDVIEPHETSGGAG